MFKVDKINLNILWVHKKYRKTIYIIYWMTNKEACDSSSSASITFNQALLLPGYDRGPPPSYFCWYSPFTSVMWLIEPEIEVYITTSTSTEPDFNAILLALFIKNTWFLWMCILPRKRSTLTCTHSTSILSTDLHICPGHLVLHIDAFLLVSKSENN